MQFPRLTWLDLQNHIEIGAASLQDIGKGLTKLEYLNVSWASVTSVGIAHLAALLELRDLELGQGSYDGSCLKHLAKLPKLEKLFVVAQNFNREDYAEFPKFPSLTNLKIDRADQQFGEEALRHLSKTVRGLKTLSVSGVLPDVNDDLIKKYLSAMKHLTTLEIDSYTNKFTLDSIEEVRKEIPWCLIRTTAEPKKGFFDFLKKLF